MNQQELRSALSVTDGKVVISGGRLTPNINRLLIDCYDNQPLTISDAKAGPGDGDGGAVVITGRAPFLGTADLPVTARFTADGANGEVRASIRYELIGDAPGPDRWTFTRSLPSLPPVMNYGAQAVRLSPANPEDTPDTLAGHIPYLSSLDLLSTAYVVSSEEQQDAALGITLARGINFISKLRPEGTIAVLRRTFGETDPLLLHGTVRIPKGTDVTSPLEYRQYPWSRAEVPGVLLEASLGKGGAMGGVRFENPRLLIYSPHDSTWQKNNPTFQPLIAYTGTVVIPSANVSVDVTSLVRWGMDDVFLFGDVQGVSLEALGNLADAAGGDDLMAHMPDELQKAASTLGKISLTYLSLQLTLDSQGLFVGSVGFIVGMPGFKWKVWGDHVVVEDIAFELVVDNPFGPRRGDTSTLSQRKVTVGLMGTLDIEGVPILIRASNENKYTVYGRLQEGQSIPLKKLLATYAPDVPPPSDLTVSAMSLTISSTYLAMSLVMASRPNEWIIDLGPSKLKVENVTFDFRRPVGGSTTGAFAGTIAFGKYAVLSTRFDVPGGFVLCSTFPKINLSHLIETLCDQKTPLPDGFDLVLENASMVIQKQNDSYTFRVATGVKDFGLLAFEVRKVGGRWGFATGLSLGNSRISSLPGLGGLKSIEDSVKLQKLLLVISSFEDAGFTFPDMAQFNRPQLGTQKLALPSQATGVVPGLMAFAEWQLDPGSREQGLLKELLGLGGTQSASVVIGANPLKDFRLYVSQRSSIQKQPFQCKFGVELANARPSFFLAGAMTTKIQGQPQTFDLTTAFVPTGAFLAAAMKGATAVNCGPFKLSNMALQIGVNWGGIPSLGVAATIDVKSFESSLAVFFDSTEPSRSLVGGSISSLTAKDVMDTLVGGSLKTPIDDVLQGIAIKGTHEFTIPEDLTDELDNLDITQVAAAFAAAKVTIPSSSSQVLMVMNKKGEAWHLTDLTTMRHYQLKKGGGKIQVSIAPQFYFAPQPTFIGSIKYPQAYYLNAAISFAGFDAAATVDISQNKGFSCEAQMDKIVLLDEKLFSIAALQGGGGPKISISTFTQPENPVAQFRPPHFYINGGLTMLGVKEGIYASASVQGIDFDLVGNLVPGVKFDLSARFGKAGLGATGKVKVGVGTVDLGALGKAKVNTELEVEVDLDIDLGAKTVSVTPGPSYSADATLLSNENARFVFQGDGNLVLYKLTGTDWEPAWASNTAGRGGKQVAFQGDGNLVIYTGAGKPIWASNTNGQGIAKLVLQGDGDVVLFDGSGGARWRSGTGGDKAGASIELESSFEFAGQHIDIARFKLEPKADTFVQLPSIVAKKVEDALRDVFKDMTKWTNAVSKGAMEGVNDTAKVFKDVYGKSEKEANQLAGSVSKGVNQGSKAVENVAKDVGKSAEKTTKKAIKKVKFW